MKYYTVFMNKKEVNLTKESFSKIYVKKNSIFLLGACEIGMDKSYLQTLLSKGSRAVFSYNTSVIPEVVQKQFDIVLNYLSKGKSPQYAYSQAIKGQKPGLILTQK